MIKKIFECYIKRMVIRCMLRKLYERNDGLCILHAICQPTFYKIPFDMFGFNKYKPAHISNCGVYWFELDEDGLNKRISILKNELLDNKCIHFKIFTKINFSNFKKHLKHLIK